MPSQVWNFKAKGVLYLYSQQEGLSILLSKSIHFPAKAEKTQKCTCMVEFRGSRDSGTGRTLCQGENWLWQVIRQCQHRVCPLGHFSCKVTPHFPAQNCYLEVALFPTTEEWRGATQTLRDCWNKNVMTNTVLSSWVWFSVRPGMLWCCSTAFTALSLQYIFTNKQVWISLRDH